MSRAADVCYLISLVCLPLVGVDLVTLALGRDLGAGFQPAYLTLAAAIALRAVWFARARLRAAKTPLIVTRPTRALAWAAIAVAAALLVSGVGILAAPGIAEAGLAWGRFLRQIVQAAVMACFVFYPALWTRGEARWQLTGRLLAVGLAVQVLYALAQGIHFVLPVPGFAALDHLATTNPAILAGSEELFLEGRFRGVPRLRGTVCEPLYLGSYLLLVIPLVAVLARGRRGVRPLLAGAGVVLLLTWSRGAYVGAVAGVAVWLLARRRAGLGLPVRHILLLAGGTFLVATVVSVLVAGADAWLYPLRRLVQSVDRQDWSNLTRFYSMQAAWRAFLTSPVFGIGWGQFAFHFSRQVDPLGLQSQFTWPVVNNFPLLVLCETGLVGFSVLVVLAWRLVRATWRRLAGAGAARSALPAATAAAAAAVTVQLLTFSQYNLPHLWILPGLWFAALEEFDRR